MYSSGLAQRLRIWCDSLHAFEPSHGHLLIKPYGLVSGWLPKTMKDIAISVRNVSKCYPVFESQRDRLCHAIFPSRKEGGSEVWALRDISFDIKRGDSVAVIGCNGSGKSTLLEVITGTLTPTKGCAEVNGRVAALLELGSGFNPEFTGRENVFLNGLLFGLSRTEVAGRFDDIQRFADIGDVLERPVKTYSSGMLVRLAFAVQVALDPEILIVDEALSVGDFFFQQKCLARIHDMQARGVTILFVSHDMQTVRDLCQMGLFLKSGVVEFWGDNLTAINRYLASSKDESSKAENHTKESTGPGTFEMEPTENTVAASAKEPTPGVKLDALPDPLWVNPHEAGEVALCEVGVYNTDGMASLVVEMGKSLIFRVRYQNGKEKRSDINLVIRNRYNQIVTAVGTYTHDVQLSQLGPGEIGEVVFELEFTLEAGEYSFHFNTGTPSGPSKGNVLHETPWMGPMTIAWDYHKHKPPFFGLFGIPAKITAVHPIPSD